MILDIIQCNCSECDCHKEFESISKEELLNVIQHGRLNQKQIKFAKKRIGSKICERCFEGKHLKSGEPNSWLNFIRLIQATKALLAGWIVKYCSISVLV